MPHGRRGPRILGLEVGDYLGVLAMPKPVELIEPDVVVPVVEMGNGPGARRLIGRGRGLGQRARERCRRRGRWKTEGRVVGHGRRMLVSWLNYPGRSRQVKSGIKRCMLM